MQIQEALKQHHNIEIELLLAHALKKPKEFLYLSKDHRLTARQMEQITRMAKRRMRGEPIAYILGYKDFYGMRFNVNRDVLVPRPETEWLVERALSHVVQGIALPSVKQKQATSSLKLRSAGGLHYTSKIKILDLGTGSGCIIISLAKQLSVDSYQLTASDISAKALAVAKQNAKTHGVKIKFIKSDLFDNITGSFDFIIGNLPYIPLKMLRKHLHHKTQFSAGDPFIGLRYEPPFALTDGGSTWQIYRRFFEQAGSRLNPKSLIFLEIDPASRKFLTEYQKKYLPKANIKFYRDFNNFWRYAEITL